MTLKNKGGFPKQSTDRGFAYSHPSSEVSKDIKALQLSFATFRSAVSPQNSQLWDLPGICGLCTLNSLAAAVQSIGCTSSGSSVFVGSVESVHVTDVG